MPAGRTSASGSSEQAPGAVRLPEFDRGIARRGAGAAPLGPSGGAARGFRRAGGRAERDAEVTKLAADAPRGEPLLAQGALPRQTLVGDHRLGKAQLGVRKHDQGGPPVGLRGGAEPWRGPVRGAPKRWGGGVS